MFRNPLHTILDKYTLGGAGGRDAGSRLHHQWSHNEAVRGPDQSAQGEGHLSDKRALR